MASISQNFSQDGANASSQRNCAVCSAGAKYKCPTCFARTCSLACYKQHRDACSTKESHGCEKPTDSREKDYGTVALKEDEEETDRVSAERLAELGNCDELRKLLKDVQVRKSLVEINELVARSGDDTSRVEAALRSAMQDADFCRVANTCLRVVDPEAYANVRDELADDFDGVDDD